MRPTGHPLRVLVVEDEPLIAMIVEDALEALGCEIIGPIAELNEALAAAERGDFDCAILDINIRGGLSYPVATLLIDRSCPILLATGYRSESIPPKFSGQAFIAKPYSSAQMEHEIRQLCNRVRFVG